MTFRKPILLKSFQGEVFWCFLQRTGAPYAYMTRWASRGQESELPCPIQAICFEYAVDMHRELVATSARVERTGDTWGLYFWEIGRSCSMKLCGDNFCISSQRISHQSFWQRLFLVERFQVKSIASMQRHHPHARTTILQENRRTNRISLTYCG